MRFRSPSASISLTARSFALLALALATFALGGACEDKHVGRICELGTMPLGGSTGSIATVSSPALECPSHICLLPGAEKDPRSAAQMMAGVAGTGPLCTATCESNEDCETEEIADANNAADKRCRGGFACAWPTTVGNFACQRMCVCTDFVTPPIGGFKQPSVCAN
jgi:hypothetical protein